MNTEEKNKQQESLKNNEDIEVNENLSRVSNNESLYKELEPKEYIESRDPTLEELQKLKKRFPKGSLHIYDDEDESLEVGPKEKSHKTERINSLSPTDVFNQTMRNRSLGVMRYFLAFINFGTAAINKIQARFTKTGQKLDDYASGNSKKLIQKSHLNLDETKKFIQDEIKSVQNYNELMKQQEHEKATAFLKERKVSRDDFIKDIFKNNKLSPEAQELYIAYKTAENTNNFSEEKMAELYDNPNYLNGLNLYAKRFNNIERLEQSIHKKHSTTDEYEVNLQELRDEYQESNKEFLEIIGFNVGLGSSSKSIINDEVIESNKENIDENEKVSEELNDSMEM